MACAPWHTVRRLIATSRGEFHLRTFSGLAQFLCRAFAPWTDRERLRAQPTTFVYLGVRGTGSRRARADANESRDWRIHVEFAQARIRMPVHCLPNAPLQRHVPGAVSVGVVSCH
jgi:hypothetical protein